jgi:hypothetical protein
MNGEEKIALDLALVVLIIVLVWMSLRRQNGRSGRCAERPGKNIFRAAAKAAIRHDSWWKYRPPTRSEGGPELVRGVLGDGG